MIVTKEDIDQLSKLDTVEKILDRYAEIMVARDNMESFSWYKQGDRIYATHKRPLVGEDPKWKFVLNDIAARELSKEFTSDLGIQVGEELRYTETIDDFIYEVVWDRLYSAKIKD